MLLAGSLKPNESLTQLVSGLIVVLTFTLAASVATGGQQGARSALVGAIAANVSWGIINAVLYVMDSAFDRNRQIRIARAIASTSDEAAALSAIRNELDPYLVSVTRVDDREQLYRNVRSALTHGHLPRRTEFLRDDMMGAVAVFFLALAATVPAILPLLIIDHPWLALRVSNGLVIGSLFFVGYHWAKYIDANPWLAGFGLMALGMALVVVAIRIGG
jgi:VIT1/CCC1 family predicted Fe2+/Mn2+ transporter